MDVMKEYLAIVVAIFSLIIILKRFSASRIRYYLIGIPGVLVVMLLLGNIFSFVFNNLTSAFMILVSFISILIYCEKHLRPFVEPSKAPRSNLHKTEISQGYQEDTTVKTHTNEVRQDSNETKPNLDSNSLRDEITELVAICQRLEDMNINQSRFEPPATEEEISNWERAYSTSIPESYKEWLRFSNDAEIIGFTARLLGVKHMGACPSVFPNENPNDLAIIGHMGGSGDMLCFSKSTGRIVWLYDWRERDEFDSFKGVLLELIREAKGIIGEDESSREISNKLWAFYETIRNSDEGLTAEQEKVWERMESKRKEIY